MSARRTSVLLFDPVAETARETRRELLRSRHAWLPSIPRKEKGDLSAAFPLFDKLSSRPQRQLPATEAEE